MKFSTTVALAFAGFSAAGTIPNVQTRGLSLDSISTILSSTKTSLDANVVIVKSAMDCLSGTKAFDPTCMQSVVGSLLKFTTDLKTTGTQLRDSLKNASTILTATDINALIGSIEKAKEISSIVINAAKNETSVVKGLSTMVAFMFKSQIMTSKAAGSAALGPLLGFAMKVTGDGTTEAAEALAKLKSIIGSLIPKAPGSPKPSSTAEPAAPACTS